MFNKIVNKNLMIYQICYRYSIYLYDYA